MVKATIQSRGGVHRIECVGHATGSIQVCAAVSGLITALAGYLINCGGEKIRQLDMRAGYSVIEFKGENKAFQLTKTGLLQIANSYPEYFCVIL